MDIDGKVAFITGGVSGMGEATARAYLAKGARVALLDRNAALGRTVVAEFGDRAVFYCADVCNEAQVERALQQTVDRFGELHICNNFAGIAAATRMFGRDGVHPLRAYTDIIDINLVGTFNVCRLASALMAKNSPFDPEGGRGVIINTASIAAFEGQVGQVAYSASKGGIVAMSLPMARDLARYGIRVNVIAPGLIHTPLCDGMSQALYENLTASIVHPKRMGYANEVAHLSVMIAENEFINGECIRIDGGARLQPN